MRLIDADRFKEYITLDDDDLGLFKTEKQKQLTISIMEAIKKDIDEQPTIDAVEVVRCKDCKHRFNGEHHDNCCDVLMEKVKWTFEVTVEPDWFCADGKRRNDG